ncbi:hypothetical protein F4818DRAFT_398360 [Hypoxylon cercidicola]|nr:hypothetical protein F4818DRAFT_398360 [Hypoxylon cercidicola]
MVFSTLTTITTTNPSVYPLTTTFTPPPGCQTLFLDACYDVSDCTATRPSTVCPRGTEEISDLGGPACYPHTSVNQYGSYNGYYITYSPGLVCPIGMMTAASAISPDGVWCCPTGLTWAANAPWCTTRLTEGVFISPARDCNTAGPTITFGAAAGTETFVTDSLNDGSYVSIMLAASEIVVTAMAVGIFLAGQTMAATAASTNPVAAESSNRQSSTGITGATARGIVGGVVAGIGLLLFFAFWWRKRSRQKRERINGQAGSVEEVHYAPDQSHSFEKPELDASASATRNELEGSLGKSRDGGAGIYVRKPELEGTPGTSGADGTVYVLSKAELEASQKTVIAELEAISVSRLRGGRGPVAASSW